MTSRFKWLRRCCMLVACALLFAAPAAAQFDRAQLSGRIKDAAARLSQLKKDYPDSAAAQELALDHPWTITSLSYLEHSDRFGAWVRGMHLWGAYVLILVVGLHMMRTALRSHGP